MNVCIIAGARPNFIKVAPITWAIARAAERGEDIAYHLVYTGSKEDVSLEPSLFDDIGMLPPHFYLGVDCENLNELTGKVMSAFEKHLQTYPAEVVIVVDDLASTMAAAIVAKKKNLVLAHLVAGTRTFDITVPKEINRLVIDGLSDLLFTAGIDSNSNATREGVEMSKIYMVGNILIDTLRANYNRFYCPKEIEEIGVEERKYIVFTLNRKALVADKENLKRMINNIVEASEGIPVIAPLRSGVAEVIKDMVADYPSWHIVKPMPYLEFGYLTSHAMGIITDSGNVAEEATFNGVPCITLNKYTEHIETVKKGSNVLADEDSDKLGGYVRKLCKGQWKECEIPDRWDGRSADRIVRILLRYK